ncbi:MAG: bifunctional (p)ppGpp synthetase/guanosine-3',5'-bis(diphosphate) 3'-pyrophosphohydrolase, partial [Deltaproteobacteria bacterium]|nr:bifunctional (p)ppGpp synthetase/guanosine-3',5'-bis(diphosphate) 3'-pyrophosphohydrolase [Deltaproteobacteria bacterium]
LGNKTEAAIRAATLLLSQHTDHVVIASALLASLHNVDKPVDDDGLAKRFGPTISELVKGLKWTGVMRTDTEAHRMADLDLLLKALSNDLRSVILRIGLRLVELEQLPETSSPKAVDIARETLDVYVPLASRMGMAAVQEQLEDACFRLLEPEAYEELARQVQPLRAEDEACLAILMKTVRRILKRNSVQATVSGRTKGIYSLYRKILKRNASLEAIMDKIGIRIVVPSVMECYKVLGLLHTHFRPIPGTFDDYIGLPKENGYQSLHTCVYPIRHVSHKPVEFQIRSELMHMEAEFGVAAHWRYKSHEEAQAEGERQLRWLQSLQKQREDVASHTNFIDQLREDVFNDHLVIFTEGGQKVRMPAGSTLGRFLRRCNIKPEPQMTVLVNGQQQPMEYPLQDGDSVFIPPQTRARSSEPAYRHLVRNAPQLDSLPVEE